MASWLDRLPIGLWRSKSRVDRVLRRYESTYGERALQRVLTEMERPDLRSSYRDVLKAVAGRLHRQGEARAKSAAGGLAAVQLLLKPRKNRSAA